MSEILEILSKEEFNQTLKDNKLVLVDFYATWCGPCKMQSPILHEFKEEVGDKVVIIKLDVDQTPDIAREFGILSIPTLLLFKDAQVVEIWHFMCEFVIRGDVVFRCVIPKNQFAFFVLFRFVFSSYCHYKCSICSFLAFCGKKMEFAINDYIALVFSIFATKFSGK